MVMAQGRAGSNFNFCLERLLRMLFSFFSPGAENEDLKLSHYIVNNVSEYLPEWILIHSLFHRFEASSDLGFQGEKWTHQKDNR